MIFALRFPDGSMSPIKIGYTSVGDIGVPRYVAENLYKKIYRSI